MKLSGWGRYPRHEASLHHPRDMGEIRTLLATNASVIARGNGRAYGDSAINTSATVQMTHWNMLLDFDTDNGVLVAQAGVLLGDILSTFIPRGWFLQVTPGTKFVTLGGAIAADVHGKNHHCDGSFRNCVEWIDVLMADGNTRRCSRVDHPKLFDLTLGGMGLTGIILCAAIRLRPIETGWITQTTQRHPNLAATLAAFEAAQNAPYSVAWIDCLATGRELGRSVLMQGQHTPRCNLPAADRGAPFTPPARRRWRMPFDLPGFMLNRTSVRGFNALYYRRAPLTPKTHHVDWDSYFYPLDSILGWNRIYGRRGFVQFQCVLPLTTALDGLTTLLTTLSQSGASAFLGVLKRMGPQDGAVSFPMEGYTLALDCPVHSKSLAVLEVMDAITLDHGGRFYLAKDARMSASTLQASDPRLASFAAYRQAQQWNDHFASAQSDRLKL